MVAVPPGARFSRRSSSWRGGSAATLSSTRLAADGSAAYAFDTASTRIGSGENSASRSAKNRAWSFLSRLRYRSNVILASDTPAASPRSDSNFLQLTIRRRTLSRRAQWPRRVSEQIRTRVVPVWGWQAVGVKQRSGPAARTGRICSDTRLDHKASRRGAPRFVGAGRVRRDRAGWAAGQPSVRPGPAWPNA